jgi:hypothetical protein
MAGTQLPAAATVDLADILRQYGPTWLKNHPAPLRYRKVMRAIVGCRTAAMGGRRQWCLCGYQRYVYFSCRNRHCPQCQTMAKEMWREARQSELLPVPYFHHVFTIPHQLNRLVLWNERNQRALLKLLFDAVAATLLKFGQEELNGQVGFTLVLHTWDQRLRPHFHLHCLMPSGALAEGRSKWIAGGSRFLFSVRALSKVYRGKFLEGLTALWKEERLMLPPDLASLDERGWKAWAKCLRKHSWVVYSKPPFAGPRKLLDYLSRYTHRVAISNDRIQSSAHGEVKFTYRDRADANRRKLATIPADDFISRFMRHILPDRFTRVRHYGFLANRNKKESLAQIRQLLGTVTPSPESPQTTQRWLQEVLGVDPTRCPCCGRSLFSEILPLTDVPQTTASPAPVTTIARPPP